MWSGMFLALFPVRDGHSQGILPKSCVDGLVVECVFGQPRVSASRPRAGELRKEQENPTAYPDQGDQWQPWNGGRLIVTLSHGSSTVAPLDTIYWLRVFASFVNYRSVESQ